MRGKDDDTGAEVSVEKADVTNKELELDSVVKTMEMIQRSCDSVHGAMVAESLIVALGNYAMSLADKLPAEKRVMILNQVGNITAAAKDAVEKAKEKELVEQDKQLLLQETFNLHAVNPELEGELEEDLGILDIFKDTETPEEEKHKHGFFTEVLDSLELEHRVPLHEKFPLMNAVFTPEESATFLTRETTVNATHAILTEYPDHKEKLPEATKAIIDDFRDVEKNTSLVQQCDELCKRLTEQRTELESQGHSTETLDKIVTEAKHTKTIAETTIRKEAVKEELTSLSKEDVGKDVAVDETSTGLNILKKLREQREQNKAGKSPSQEDAKENTKESVAESKLAEAIDVKAFQKAVEAMVHEYDTSKKKTAPEEERTVDKSAGKETDVVAKMPYGDILEKDLPTIQGINKVRNSSPTEPPQKGNWAAKSQEAGSGGRER